MVMYSLRILLVALDSVSVFVEVLFLLPSWMIVQPLVQLSCHHVWLPWMRLL